MYVLAQCVRNRISCHFDDNTFQYVFKNEDTGEVFSKAPSVEQLNDGAILADWSETPSVYQENNEQQQQQQQQLSKSIDHGPSHSQSQELSASSESDTHSSQISWIRDFDDEEDQHFYKHIATKKLVWELPASGKFIDIDDPKLQRIVNIKKEKHKKNQRTFSDKIPLWIKHFDHDNDKFFYENTRTNDIRWVEPTSPYLWVRSTEHSDNDTDRDE